MANTVTTNQLNENLWDVGVAIHRTNPVPLDNKSYFLDLASAQAYAQSGATAFVGQIITVVTSGVAQQYQIKNAGGTLEPIGNTYATLNTANNATTNGYLVAGPGTASSTNYLRADGTWGAPENTTYDKLDTSHNATTNGYLVKGPGTSSTTNYLRANGEWGAPPDTTYAAFGTAAGLVPGTTNTTAYLRGDGSWATPTGTTYDKLSATNTSTSNNYLVPGAGTSTGMYLQGDGSWTKPTDTTYSKLSAANNVTTNGYLVPGAGTANNANYILAGNGNWVAKPTDTTYRVFTTNTNGLVPGPTSANTNNYLRADGSWTTPTNNTYTATGVLSMNGNAVVHNNSSLAGGTYGPNTNVIIGMGETGSIVIPEVTTDTYGHLTGVVARTLTVTIPSAPDYTISSYTAPDYDTTHVSTTWANVINSNVVAEGDTYDLGINKVDRKTSGLSNEVIWNEAVMAQAYVDAREADRYYGDAVGAATNTNFAVSISDYTESSLTNGERFVICFPNGCTTTNANITINTNLGTWPVRYNGAAIETNLIQENSRLLIAYHSNAFHIVGGAGGGDCTIVTPEDWTVAGWPNGCGGYNNGDQIVAGTDIVSILKNILSNITWPTGSHTYQWSVSGNAPSLSNSAGYSNNSYQPVGSALTITETFTSPTITRQGTINNLDYGFFTSLSGTRNTSTSYTKLYTPSSSGSVSLSMSFTGFNSAAATSTSGTSLTSTTLYLTNGVNKCTASSTSQTYTQTNSGTDTIYPSSSAFECDAEHTESLTNAEALSSVSTWNSGKNASASNTLTINGYYPWFWAEYNSPLSQSEMNSGLITSFTNKPNGNPGSVLLHGGANSGAMQFIIAVPNRSYSTLSLSTQAGSPFSTTSNTFNIDIDFGHGITYNNYRVFYMNAASHLTSNNTYYITLT